MQPEELYDSMQNYSASTIAGEYENIFYTNFTGTPNYTPHQLCLQKWSLLTNDL